MVCRFLSGVHYKFNNPWVALACLPLPFCPRPTRPTPFPLPIQLCFLKNKFGLALIFKNNSLEELVLFVEYQ